MSNYKGTAEGPDKAKAIAAVMLVHAGLGAAILTGLNVQTVTRTIDALKTFDVTPDLPPPPPPPPPRPQRASPAKQEEGVAGKKAEPSPVVLPRPRVELPVQPPIAAAPVAGRGNTSSAGAANAGVGTGAGGRGDGRGGGGNGDGGGVLTSNPQLIAGAPRPGDYRRLGARIQGRTMARLQLGIGANGLVTTCRLTNSTGYPELDGAICPYYQARMRWLPARDRSGRAIASSTDDFRIVFTQL